MESSDNNLGSKPSKWHNIYSTDADCLRIKSEYKHFGVFWEDFFFETGFQVSQASLILTT